MTFDTLLAAGSLALLIGLIILVVAWLTENPIAAWVSNNAHIILRVIFGAAVLSSLIYSNYFNFEPCLLCWYQRIFIFPAAILLFTDDIRKSLLLQRQVLLLTAGGFLIALFHNYISIFPQSGIDACGTGPSCLKLYVSQFGFVTIPLMSAITLLAGILITVLVMRYPQRQIAND
ncbi:MAG: disulfide bond formation protein [Candidatus Nomurabacteria bacterium]|nr:disulfide bond formation protein [Candidatus Nomurabacteria bacterium]